MRSWFAREVAKRTGESGPPRWLIVMSGPFTFATQELVSLPRCRDPNRHIVYLRFLSGGFGPGPQPGAMEPTPDVRIAPVPRVHGPVPGLGTVMHSRPGRGPRPDGRACSPDDFERVLKPMGAQIISVTSPDILRKTIASLIAEMSAQTATEMPARNTAEIFAH